MQYRGRLTGLNRAAASASEGTLAEICSIAALGTDGKGKRRR
jgi:hypothetical protein